MYCPKLYLDDFPFVPWLDSRKYENVKTMPLDDFLICFIRVLLFS